MNPNQSPRVTSVLAVLLIIFNGLGAKGASMPRAVLPDAIVDLSTLTGTGLLNAQWRYSDTEIRHIQHRDVGPDLKANGNPHHTFDFVPDARASNFDDSRWEIIPPESLEKRRGHGRLSLNWYRLLLTLPEKIAGLDVKGSTVVFEIVVDDYAEVWVNGKLGMCSASKVALWSPVGTLQIA